MTGHLKTGYIKTGHLKTGHLKTGHLKTGHLKTGHLELRGLREVFGGVEQFRADPEMQARCLQV